MTIEELEQAIIELGAEDDQSIVAAMEDGALMERIGANIEAVEELHDLLTGEA